MKDSAPNLVFKSSFMCIFACFSPFPSHDCSFSVSMSSRRWSRHNLEPPPVYPPNPCGFQSFGLQIHQENQKSDREPIRWIHASQLSWAQNVGASDAPGMRTTFNGFQRISRDSKEDGKPGDSIVCCRKACKSFEFGYHGPVFLVHRIIWCFQSAAGRAFPQAQNQRRPTKTWISGDEQTQTVILGQRVPGKGLFETFGDPQNTRTVKFWLFRLIIGTAEQKHLRETFWTFQRAAARN